MSRFGIKGSHGEVNFSSIPMNIYKLKYLLGYRKKHFGVVTAVIFKTVIVIVECSSKLCESNLSKSFFL